jgi:hypothetical protein
LAADSGKATLGKGVRSTPTSARDVEHTHLGWWSSTTAARRTTAAKGATRCGGADIRSAATGKAHVRRVSIKTSEPGIFEIVAPISLSHPTSSLVGTHHRQKCLWRYARVLVKAHRPSRRSPYSVNHKGSVRAVLSALADRERQTRHEERQTNHLWLWFPPPCFPFEGMGKPMLGGGLYITSDDGVRGSGRDLRRPKRGGFSPDFPPNSGTTGVAHEPRSL